MLFINACICSCGGRFDTPLLYNYARRVQRNIKSRIVCMPTLGRRSKATAASLNTAVHHDACLAAYDDGSSGGDNKAT